MNIKLVLLLTLLFTFCFSSNIFAQSCIIGPVSGCPSGYSCESCTPVPCGMSGGVEIGACQPIPTLPACFLPGTKISVADGTKKNIEDVKVGDKVLSYETDIEKLQAIMKRKYDKQQKENYDNMSFMEKIEFKFQQKWDKWFGFLTPVEMM